MVNFAADRYVKFIKFHLSTHEIFQGLAFERTQSIIEREK